MMAAMALEEPAGDAWAADNNNKKYLKRCGPDSKELRAFSFLDEEDLRHLPPTMAGLGFQSKRRFS
jgi:hypothetical protein